MPIVGNPGIPYGTSQQTIVKPWYSFPRIDNFGQIDPQGNYWKPDSNILTPPLYPVTVIYSGTITSVQRTSYGQTVVTEKLDTPYNGLATHMFFEHMHNAVVNPGRHLQAGDTIGYTNDTGEGANLGVGLYSGDVYGQGTAWQVLQNDLAPGGAGLLNPTKILDGAKSGKIPVPGQSLNLANASSSNCGLLDIGCWAQNVGEHIAIFLIGLIMIILGFFLLAEKQVTGLAKKAIV